MKFGEAKVVPYISIDAGTFAPESQAEPTQMSEHARIAALMAHGTNLFGEGRTLRAEAEGFVVWSRWMGERDGAPSWGDNQKAYAADWRARYRAKAQAFRALIVADGRDPETTLNRIFSAAERVRCDYGDDVTAAARQELGI